MVLCSVERPFVLYACYEDTMILKENTTDRRELILATALRLFTEQGYFNTTVHDIKKEAGVSIGSIYHYFSNKESIAKDLFDTIEETMVDAINSIMQNTISSHDRCKAVLEYFFEATETSRNAMHYMLYAKHSEFIPGEGPVCTSRPFVLMRQIIVEGIQTKEIRSLTPEIVGVNIFGGAIRLICLRVDGVIDKPLPSYLDEFWECACYGITA